MQLEQNKAELEGEIIALNSSNEQLGSALSDRESESEHIKTNNQNLATEASKIKERFNELTTQISSLEATHAESQTSILTLSDENNKIKRDNDYISTENTKFKEQTHTLNNSVNMNSKLLIKAGIDNDALRQKYSEKLESEQSLLELINNLRERLEAAANFYGHLEQEHPEIILEKRSTSNDRDYE